MHLDPERGVRTVRSVSGVRKSRIVLLGVAAAALTIVVASSGASAASGPPTIREPFDRPNACLKNSTATLPVEACRERTLLASDRTINALTNKIFLKLAKSQRPGFVRGEIAWLTYRR